MGRGAREKGGEVGQGERGREGGKGDALVDQGRDAAVPEEAPRVLGGGDVGLAVQGDLDAAGGEGGEGERSVRAHWRRETGAH